MSSLLWDVHAGDGPVVAVAVHDGHEVRDEVAELLALAESDRLREEDPFTGEWAALVPSRIVARRSRFEVDLNRPRDEAFYRRPEDAWGLRVWSSPPSDELVARSLEEHDRFYEELGRLLRDVERRHGRFVLLDLHSYNHRRAGARGPAADPAGNPQINLGTGTMDRPRWARLVDRFVADVRAYPFPGGRLDIRENVKFKGRRVPQFVHQTFPQTGCALAVEVKKFFMDEWSGERDPRLFGELRSMLASTLPGLVEELRRR